MNPTQKAILEAAVVQFAEKGFDGASMREILRDAKVNAASGHYHFGSKEVVYEEVIRRYVTPLCAQRLEALKNMDPHLSGRKRIEALIRNYVAPHLMLCRDPSAHAYVRLLARFISEPHTLTGKIYTELLEPVRSQYLTALGQAAPFLSSDEVKRLFGFVVTLMATSPLDVSYGDLSGHEPWPNNPEDLIDQVVAFTSSGFWDLAKKADRQAPKTA